MVSSQWSVVHSISAALPISAFCFLLSPKRPSFGALRPHAEPPFVQKLHSDPATTRTAPVPTPGLGPFPGTSSFRIQAESKLLAHGEPERVQRASRPDSLREAVANGDVRPPRRASGCWREPGDRDGVLHRLCGGAQHHSRTAGSGEHANGTLHRRQLTPGQGTEPGHPS